MYQLVQNLMIVVNVELMILMVLYMKLKQEVFGVIIQMVIHYVIIIGIGM